MNPFMKNFDDFFILRWYCARDLFGSQTAATLGVFELQISCISYGVVT